MKAIERGYDVYHTLRQTLESGWEVLARQPAVPVLAECAGRLLLGVMLSAAIFIYAVAFAFYDMPVYQKRWFMPLCGGRHCQRPPGPRPPRSGKGPAPGVAPLTGPPGPRLSLLPQDQR